MRFSNLLAITIVVVLPTMTFGQEIPGYDHGKSSVPQSPISLQVVREIQKSLLMTNDDLEALRMSKAILEPQVDEILDVWYGFVASTPHLVHYFKNTQTGQPDSEYLARVRERFKQWVLDTADANYDQDWLNYQQMIALRHHRTAKNQTDRVNSVPIIHFRHLVALQYPVTATLKPFLAKAGHSPEDVERMHQAWIKSVQLQVILWSYPYVKNGDF